MPDPINRKIQMLQFIPRAPRKVDAATLQARLRELGFDVDRRTIQRDLVALSATFPLISDDKSKPFGWSWVADAKPLAAPSVDLHLALAFRLAEDLLDPLLPATTRRNLQPHFDLARQRLDALQGSALRSWPDKIRVIPGGVRRIPPMIDPQVLDVVQTGLFEERCLDIAYRSRGAKDCKHHRAVPLGLVYRDIMGYLVAVDMGHDDPTQFALHRIQHVEITAEPAVLPTGFKLDDYVKTEAFGFLLGEKDIHLKVALDVEVSATLLEAPLSPDQRVTPIDDERVLVEATVRDTTALRTWLRGYGPRLEVMEPLFLRKELREEIRELASTYRIRRPVHRTTSR